MYIYHDVHTCVYTHIIPIHTSMPCIHTAIHPSISPSVHPSVRPSAPPCIHPCTYVCMYIYIYIIFTWIWLYKFYLANKCICWCTYVYVRLYTLHTSENVLIMPMPICRSQVAVGHGYLACSRPLNPQWQSWRAQYPLIKEYGLKYIGLHIML